MAIMANHLALDVWLRVAGKETIIMMNKGKLTNLIIVVKQDIPYVQTRFRVKVRPYWGPTEHSTCINKDRLWLNGKAEAVVKGVKHSLRPMQTVVHGG